MSRKGDFRVAEPIEGIYAVMGERDDSRRKLGELLEKERPDPFFAAEIHAALGEKDQAREWLEKALEERHHRISFLTTDPHFESLRSEPWFQGLLEKARSE